MSFEIDLESARTLAAEYTRLHRTIQSMAAAEDHDPNWNAQRAAELDALTSRFGELVQQLAGEVGRMAREHPSEWRAFLASSVERLQLLAKHDKPLRMVSYEADEWTSWLRGQAPRDPAEIFARGIRVLAEYREDIEQLAK